MSEAKKTMSREERLDSVSGEIEKLKSAYQTLIEVMPEYFFRAIDEHIGDLLPLLCNLDPAAGVRRADLGTDIFLVYFRDEQDNPRTSSRRMAGRRLFSATIHQAEKPIRFDERDYLLVVEHYVICGAGETTTPAVSCDELIAAFRALGGGDREAELREIYGRINFSAVADLDAERLAQRIRAALDAQAGDSVHAELEDWPDGKVRLTVSLAQPVSQPDLFSQLTEAVDLAGFEAERLYFRELTRGGLETDFGHLPVMVTTLYLSRRGGDRPAGDERETLLQYVRMINYVEMDDLLHRELVRRHHFRLDEVNFLRAAAEFAHSQLAFIDRNGYNSDDILRFLALSVSHSARLCAEFRRRFAPGAVRDEKEEARFHTEFAEAVGAINSGEPARDFWMRNVFRAAGNFLECIDKCNFFSVEKAALAFRLNPRFMEFYRELDERYGKAFPADRPFAVFFFYRRNAVGFHVRFSEIARGGWRTVVPPRAANELERFDYYAAVKDELFRECFVLAHTQHLKNKDIYEGGAKMVTLLEPIADRAFFRPILWQAQRCVFLAFLSLINYDENDRLRDGAITDHLDGREIIEIGPDENMFDPMIEYMGETAVRLGYTLGSGIISGKPDTGINHKEYGVTSFGVHQYVLKTLAELGIDPGKDAFSVKISGGPAGDVAGNEMKLLLKTDEAGRPLYPGLRIVAVTDGPAAICDPTGIDRDELESLLFVKALDAFNPEKLGEGGYIVYSAPIRRDDEEFYRLLRRTNGELAETLLTRDGYMQIFQGNLTCFADIFIPAGGRPSTINEGNWENYFPDGKPSFRAIVEGANSFISPAARTAIQERGVWIIKDASANKCGVITSSYEILAGLMLSDDEFRSVRAELVPEVMEILRRRACREADWLYGKFRAEATFLTTLTDRLSREINSVNAQLFRYLGEHPEYVTDALIESHLPPLFSTRYADRPARLPRDYRRAIASVELAGRMVYAQEGEDLGRQITALLSDRERAAVKS